MSHMLRHLIGGGGGSGSMTAGFDVVTTSVGYGDSALATHFGTSAWGSATGVATAFGTVSGLYRIASSILAMSSPVGTPTTITIDGTGYSLSFDSTDGGFYFYTITSGPSFGNGVTYSWSLA